MAPEFVSKFDYRPAAIIERLVLVKAIYRRTTNYGHFRSHLLLGNNERIHVARERRRTVKNDQTVKQTRPQCFFAHSSCPISAHG